MKPRFIKPGLLAVCFLLLLAFSAGCGGAPVTKTPVEALRLALGRAYEVVHTEPIDGGVILLYRPEPNALDAALIERTKEGWKWVFGGGTAKPQGIEPIISWSYILLRDPAHQPQPLSIYYGEVFSKEVAYVEVEEQDRPKRRLAISSGLKFWITVFDRSIDHPTKVRAGTSDGRIIYNVISTGKFKLFE